MSYKCQYLSEKKGRAEGEDKGLISYVAKISRSECGQHTAPLSAGSDA